MNIELLKQQIIQQLVPLQPEKIILFGSYAYGTPNKDSDLDLCVVYKEVESKIKKKRAIRQRLYQIELPKDILTPSVKEFDFYRNEINSVYSDIDKKGIVLWQNS